MLDTVSIIVIIIIFAISLISLILCFKFNKDIKLLKKAIEGEANIRKKQDWKLYYNMKSNFNNFFEKK